MRNYLCVINGFLLLVLILASPLSAQERGTKEVIASGEKMIEKGNVGAARQLAIEEALRSAVEKGLGVFVSSESYVKNYQILEDKIYSKAEGYVKKYDVVSENQLGNRYRVTIRALVSLDALRDDLFALDLLREQMHNPRLMIVVGTRQGKVDEAARSARIQLEKEFAERHFDLIDPATSKKLHNNVKMLLDVTKETVIAAKIGLEHHAEVVLTGIIDSELIGKDNMGFELARSNLALRVIDPTTAQIFASTEEQARGAGQTNKEALSAAGHKVAEKVAPYANQEIVNWWIPIHTRGITYRITLNNVKQYQDAMVFEDAIRAIENVDSVTERVFGGGFLECDVVYKGAKSNLTRAIFLKLDGKPGFENLNVEVGTGNNIIFKR